MSVETVTSPIRTHKEEQDLGDEFIHDWPVASVPRVPEFFTPVPATHHKGWSHFVDMVKMRNIPWAVVGETIRNGEVYKAEGDNRYRFLWTEPVTSLTFSLIVELRAEAFAYETESHYCITIYRVER